jgi:hypothetical protein
VDGDILAALGVQSWKWPHGALNPEAESNPARQQVRD